MYTHANAPVYKNHEGVIRSNDRIPPLRDAQDLSQENLASSTIEFFPPNPTSDPVGRNYDDNPLPGDRSHRIIGLGFAFSYSIVSPATGIDPQLIANALSHASIVLSRGDRSKQVLRDHLRQYVEWGLGRYPNASYDDGTNSDSLEIVELPCKEFYARIDDAKTPDLQLAPDERFTLEVEFHDTTNIPTEAEWGNGTSGILQVLSFLQVVHPHNE